MAHGPRAKLRNLVAHPRYGAEVCKSSHMVDAATVRKSYYGYARAMIFPESAIPADISRQNFSTMPRRWYVDMLKECRECKRPFLFFAQEQKHWYEELGFYIDADCVRCPECRRTERALRLHFDRYSKLIVREVLSDEALAQVMGDAIFLWENGLLKKDAQLRRLNKIAQARIPRHNAAMALAALIASLRKKSAD